MSADRVRLLLALMLGGAAMMLGPVMAAAPASADNAYDELFHYVDVMAVKYGMGTVQVGQRYMEADTYAATSGSTIMFNTTYVENPAQLTAYMAHDVARHYHPGVNCSATQSVAVHEAAHVLDNITGRTARRELADAIANGLSSGELSGYSFDADGNLLPGEALADAMVAVECDTPTPAEMALYTMLTT